MRFIGSIIEKLQRHPKRVVFPEGTEPRILQAARQFYSLRLGAPILLGDRTEIKQAAAMLNVSLEGVKESGSSPASRPTQTLQPHATAPGDSQIPSPNKKTCSRRVA